METEETVKATGAQNSFDNLTLRDYFASHVAGNLLGPDVIAPENADELARRAYLYADAMLRARQQ